FELEDEAEAEHRALGRLLKSKNFNEVFLCGKLSRFAKEEFEGAKHFETKDLLIEELKKKPIQNSTVLIKASRGIGLETVLEAL
ncbi:MAG: UDP-N-acetylmuramoyl-tripeptide--D-alanyl-D-alanine ligase, partial [Cytophagales bacterium]